MLDVKCIQRVDEWDGGGQAGLEDRRSLNVLMEDVKEGSDGTGFCAKYIIRGNLQFIYFPWICFFGGLISKSLLFCGFRFPSWHCFFHPPPSHIYVASCSFLFSLSFISFGEGVPIHVSSSHHQRGSRAGC